MKRFILLGATFFIGMIAGSIAVFGYYHSNPIICLCHEGEGGVYWTGKDCPTDVRAALKEKFGGQCPLP
ncbi:hypothetical protein DSCO28_28350 [Desulfosarcina ovata subsp. sediminis]|uniref:Uncharacterized protein n=3 Tax=Desulfosarcina ovata TaxID=83564 RepID=A0A5K8AA46_9BACT|nr:hypothetical protein DSCO28_28350 [Desulfosarcina ovata subsp. sediminis]BBO89482.1 hypothetical protein DSCOOX_26620 [Desulfosarcina ovata subsp. ovata]